MRVLAMVLAGASVLGALLGLQSTLFSLAGRGPDAIQAGQETMLLALGLPLALAMVSVRGSRRLALGTFVFGALAIAAFVASRLVGSPAASCAEGASCLAPDAPPLAFQAHLVFVLGAAVLGALACAIAHALPGRSRWLPLASLALSFVLLPVGAWAERAGLMDHLTAFGFAVSAVVAAAVVLLLAKAPTRGASSTAPDATAGAPR